MFEIRLRSPQGGSFTCIGTVKPRGFIVWLTRVDQRHSSKRFSYLYVVINGTIKALSKIDQDSVTDTSSY